MRLDLLCCQWAHCEQIDHFPATSTTLLYVFLIQYSFHDLFSSSFRLFSFLYQACYPKDAGAFTGAISATQLKSLGVSWALAGHSERRVIFGETDEDINSQCLNLIEKGMSVMLCIGESEAEYDLKLAGAVCEVQLKKGLAGIPKEKVATKVAIAYEPVWAIGTGKVATPAVAQSVHATIRSILTEMYDEETADAIRVLYGGSVTPESVDDLMKEPDIDGALVGGASLDATKFARIMNFQV
jgi:triosephosphate isomerase (TIM)